tara:strand:+ start:943 stop:1473 length:531 start_codon:yes stop_codon:yes gene_type:complete
MYLKILFPIYYTDANDNSEWILLFYNQKDGTVRVHTFNYPASYEDGARSVFIRECMLAVRVLINFLGLPLTKDIIESPLHHRVTQDFFWSGLLLLETAQAFIGDLVSDPSSSLTSPASPVVAPSLGRPQALQENTDDIRFPPPQVSTPPYSSCLLEFTQQSSYHEDNTEVYRSLIY